MKRTPMKPRKAPLRSRVPIPRKARTPKLYTFKVRRKPRNPTDYARIYGSRARVRFVKYELPCAACGQYPTEECPNHNHHIVTGGTSRKADYTTIVPLCGNCHWIWHNYGASHLEFYPQGAAEYTERCWQAYSHSRKSA